MRLNRSKLPCLVTCGIMPLMVTGGFILMISLLLRNIPPLLNSVWLSRLPIEMFLWPCTCMLMVEVVWLELMMGGWLVLSSKRATEYPKGCDTPTANNFCPSIKFDNNIVYTPSWLVWDDWSVTNGLYEYFPSGVGISGKFLRQDYIDVSFARVSVFFSCFFCSLSFSSVLLLGPLLL